MTTSFHTVHLFIARETRKLTGKSGEFNRLLQNAIDDALNSFGKSVEQSIYFHLENKFNVPRKEIPKNLKAFQAGLEKIFGIGARFIEILIMKNLHAEIGLPLDMGKDCKLEFVEYMSAAEHNF